MSTPIEDYALLSDAHTAALVSRTGDVDWFCPPRFDAASVFGAILGDESHGRWSLRPVETGAVPERRYEEDTFVLVTRWTTDSGVADVIEAMPTDAAGVRILRRVVGVSGRVDFATTVRFRFDYARTLPWVRQTGTASSPAITAIAGPDAVVLRGVALIAQDAAHTGNVSVLAGEHRDLTLTWFPSWQAEPATPDVDVELARTRAWWTAWAATLTHQGTHVDDVRRSLLVLRALTHEDTGGIVAAPTTSLPERFGGDRNWDYRYVWLRDASLTLEAFIAHGEVELAHRWRRWLLRAIAGDPAQFQIMFGIAGERELPERVVGSLPGYEGSAPVRVGNGAVDQFQADVIGEMLVAMEAARRAGLAESTMSWSLQRALIGRVIATVDQPDQGIWEMRGPSRMFTQSRAAVWAALDCGIRATEDHGLPGDPDLWRAERDRVRADIDRHGVSADGTRFTQSFGSEEVDASLLLLPVLGFCEPTDPRMLATVAEIERTLLRDGLVMRYRPTVSGDGLGGEENPFLACTFWLVEQYAASGRTADAAALMRRACACLNDLGLLSEEYDTSAGRQAGNMPQAFSHLALVRAADALQGRSRRASG